MLLKRLLSNALLLGIAAARTYPNAAPVNALASRDERLKLDSLDRLIIRDDVVDDVNDDDEDASGACGVPTCRGDTFCRSTIKHRTRRSLDDLPVSSVNGTDDDFSGLLKRDIDRPEHGQLDTWFAAQWDKPNMKEVPLMSKSQTAEKEDFGDSPLMVGLRGLCGCTSVIIANRRKVYMSHFWDIHHMKANEQANPGPTDEFQKDVLDELERVSCNQFNRRRDRYTKVAIYTKWYPSRDGPVYPKSIEMMKDVLVRNIPGLKRRHIGVIGYYVTTDESAKEDTAAGGIIVTYDPNAEAGKAGFDVWAGAINENKAKVAAADINSPVISTRWNNDGSEPLPEEESEPEDDPPPQPPADENEDTDSNNGICGWTWCSVM